MNLRAIGQRVRSFIESTEGTRARWVIAFATLLVGGLLIAHEVVRSRGVWLLAGLAPVVLGIFFIALPHALIPTDVSLSPADLLKARNDVRVASIQVLGGAVLIAGLVFTNQTIGVNRKTLQLTQRSIDLAQQGQITDRFTRAIDQLGSDKLDVRLGGIYALARIARDSEADGSPIVNVLAAYLRGHRPWVAGPKPLSASDSHSLSPPSGWISACVSPLPASTRSSLAPRGADVDAVVTVLEGLTAKHTYSSLDLSSVDLGGMYLPDIQLAGARITSANLTFDCLRRAALDGADLTGANLPYAELTGAHLRRATLAGANLTGAGLTGVIFSDADLTGADLTSAGLSGSHLERANLTGANLTRALLIGAELSGAILDDADLTGATVSKEQIAAARTNGKTKLPSEVTAPPGGRLPAPPLGGGSPPAP